MINSVKEGILCFLSYTYIPTCFLNLLFENYMVISLLMGEKLKY